MLGHNFFPTLRARAAAKTPIRAARVKGKGKDAPKRGRSVVSRLVGRVRKRKAISAPPAFVPPQLATRVDAAPEGDTWLHELKLDGYRLIVRIHEGEVSLLTRSGNDWTARMPGLANALQRIDVRSAMLDGEVVVLDANGRSDFQLLQNSLHAGQQDRCIYFAFDLLFLNGEDLRPLPLVERKQKLSAILAKSKRGLVRYSEHIVGGGPGFFQQACALHAEGIVSKRASGAYVSRRDRSWLKVKCIERQEFVIGGFTRPAGSRSHLGALLLGTHQPNGDLVYAGRVGTGFTQASLAELFDQLKVRVQDEPPFVDPPRGAQAIGVRWVRPDLVAQIEYAEQTRDGIVRHASFQGLRQDKPAGEVTPDQPSKKPAPTRRTRRQL